MRFTRIVDSYKSMVSIKEREGEREREKLFNKNDYSIQKCLKTSVFSKNILPYIYKSAWKE